MRFMFYPEDRSPIEVEGWLKVPDLILRPIPRVGEKVVLDTDTYRVVDVIHIVQGTAEVRVYVKRSE